MALNWVFLSLMPFKRWGPLGTARTPETLPWLPLSLSIFLVGFSISAPFQEGLRGDPCALPGPQARCGVGDQRNGATNEETEDCPAGLAVLPSPPHICPPETTELIMSPW